MGTIADKSSKKDERFRNAVMIVYPESAYPNWRELLRAEQIPFIVSPLHDKDLNPEAPADITPDGELLPKKPHYHVAILCDGNHTLAFFESLAVKINAHHTVFKINNVRSMLRYFCHLDDPDKYQYPENEITCYCGADYKEYMELSGRALMKECKAITIFIKKEKFTNFAEFANYLVEHNFDDWFYIVSTQRTMYFSYLLRDLYYKQKDKEKKQNEK